jgi:hypothetical protein
VEYPGQENAQANHPSFTFAWASFLWVALVALIAINHQSGGAMERVVEKKKFLVAYQFKVEVEAFNESDALYQAALLVQMGFTKEKGCETKELALNVVTAPLVSEHTMSTP